MNRRLFYCLTAFVCLSCVSLHAQRTSDRTFFLGAGPSVSVCSTPRPGGEAEVGQYLLSSFWRVSLSASDYSQKLFSDATCEPLSERLDHMHVRVHADWMRRLAASYSRSVSLYAGGGAFLGYHAYQVFSSIPAEIAGPFSSGEFVYGLRACLECEVFLSTGFALTAGLRLPVTVSSSLPTDLFHLDGAIGFRINL